MAFILASRSKYLWQAFPARATYFITLFQCQTRTLSYRDFFGNPTEYAFAENSLESERLAWAIREQAEEKLHSSPRLRKPFSSRKYTPAVRELLRGLSFFHKDPIWSLVDQLVATGKPYNVADTCPDFPQFKYAIDAPNFFATVELLAAGGYLPRPQDIAMEADETGKDDEEDEVPIQMKTMPTWLALYLVVSKVDSRATALASIVFGISQIESIPARLRAPLLLLAMCAASHYRLKSQVPAIIQAFQDVYVHSGPNTTFLAAPGSNMYQYNVLLALVSQFSLVPQVATHVDRLIRHMHALEVPLEEATAIKLIRPSKSALFLVETVREILGASNSTKSSLLSVSLTRYYSKARDQKEAAKYKDPAQDIDSLAHAQTYLYSFLDASKSLAFLSRVEASRPAESESEDTSEGRRSDKVRGKFASTLSSRAVKRESSRTSLFAPSRMRGVYTSILFAAALSKTISKDTFIMMFHAVRAAHGSDRVLETVGLAGLLRRQAWAEARDMWSSWETQNAKLRNAADRAEAALLRHRTSDPSAIQNYTNRTEFETFLVRRQAQIMAVDATALAAIVRVVSGTDNTGLLEAFELMDGYSTKVIPDPAVDQGESNSANTTPFRPHSVHLTSRVINCFLTRAFGQRRPDVVFRLWDSVTQYYGVEVSVPTLELLLRSARVAASIDQSLVSVIPRWLLRGIVRDVLPEDTFDGLAHEIRWMLGPQCRPSTLWNGLPAWRVARRVFREDILFANWPWLRDIAVPAQPMRGDAATTRLDALQELAMGEPAATTGAQYSHLVPRGRTFREYVLLLGRVRRCSEIPEVLAWMRALEVIPSRKLLSLCLGLFAEVGMGTPADDMWLEGRDVGGELRHGGEYGKLVDWLAEWLGKGNVPNNWEVMASLKYVREQEMKEKIWK